MFKDKFLEYLYLEKKYSSHTINSYKRDLSDFQNFLLESDGSEKIENADKKQLRNFILYLSKNDITERSINRKISALKSFFKFLLKIEYIKINPSSTLHSLKTKKKVLIPYTEEEILQAICLLKKDEDNTSLPLDKERNLLIFDTFYQTGIRRSELINLKERQIDFSLKTINVIGKRNKERQIPIAKELLKKITQYINNKKLNDIVSEYLFCDKTGEKLKEKFVYNLINHYLSIATTKEKKSPHMLRHTFASHLLHNGAELNTIKEILGHNNLATTQIYTHSNIEDLKKVYNHAHPMSSKTKEDEH